jgi:two-component system LytT family response regulator
LIYLEELLSTNCPQIEVNGKTTTYKEASVFIAEKSPDLVFLEVDKSHYFGLEIFNLQFPSSFEVIIMSETKEFALQALNCCASGYLLKPIKKEKLIKSVHYAVVRIKSKQTAQSLQSFKFFSRTDKPSEEIIGIPTIEGYEFVPVNDIIRCEGMQKCTRIVTKDRTDLISSYNLGEFRKSLEQFGFFSPHKSHLINLNLVRKYHKEGNILMFNGSWVPVSKRRKKEFLDIINHI